VRDAPQALPTDNRFAVAPTFGLGLTSTRRASSSITSETRVPFRLEPRRLRSQGGADPDGSSPNTSSPEIGPSSSQMVFLRRVLYLISRRRPRSLTDLRAQKEGRRSPRARSDKPFGALSARGCVCVALGVVARPKPRLRRVRVRRAWAWGNRALLRGVLRFPGSRGHAAARSSLVVTQWTTGRGNAPSRPRLYP